MLSAPLVTVLAPKYGIRPPMFLGVCVLSAGFIAASFATKTWHLYITQGVMVGIGVGFIYIPSIAILPQWFQKRRSLVNGITGAGSGIGGIIFALSTAAMIDRLSLQWSLRITGIVTFVMNAVATALVKDRNKIIQPEQHPFDAQLIRRFDVWLLLAWAFISMLGYVTLLYSLPDFALSIDLSSSQAADLVTLLNVGIAVGRPLTGCLSDRFGRIVVTAILTSTCGISCFAIWIPADSFGVTALFALSSGAILGLFWVVGCLFSMNHTHANVHEAIGPLCAEVVGLQQLPSLLSLSWLTVVLPSFCEIFPLKQPRCKH